MRLYIALLTILAPASLMAQGARPAPLNFQESVEAFAIQPPDENSPFFSDREAARQERQQAARQEMRSGLGPDGTAIYPKVKGSNDSSTAIFSRFFTEMFASIKFGAIKRNPTTENLKLDPQSFSLAERREVNATYTLTNNTKKIMRIDYPTKQRLEILTKDANGTVIDRWSDDRVFEDKEDIIFINPNERIQYSEQIPTREMKAYETYEITAEVPENPDYSVSKTVVPQP